MKITLLFICLFFMVNFYSCKKENSPFSCYSDRPDLRIIKEKKAKVIILSAPESVYLVEEDAIDTRLIPCNLPNKFLQNNLQITISGKVKSTIQNGTEPCCTENFVITSITK